MQKRFLRLKQVARAEQAMCQFHQSSMSSSDPKNSKKRIKLSVFFALSGTALAKATYRTLIKLTPLFLCYLWYLSSRTVKTMNAKTSLHTSLEILFFKTCHDPLCNYPLLRTSLGPRQSQCLGLSV